MSQQNRVPAKPKKYLFKVDFDRLRPPLRSSPLQQASPTQQSLGSPAPTQPQPTADRPLSTTAEIPQPEPNTIPPVQLSADIAQSANMQGIAPDAQAAQADQPSPYRTLPEAKSRFAATQVSMARPRLPELGPVQGAVPPSGSPKTSSQRSKGAVLLVAVAIAGLGLVGVALAVVIGLSVIGDPEVASDPGVASDPARPVASELNVAAKPAPEPDPGPAPAADPTNQPITTAAAADNAVETSAGAKAQAGSEMSRPAPAEKPKKQAATTTKSKAKKRKQTPSPSPVPEQPLAVPPNPYD